jgi:hypothetical protein
MRFPSLVTFLILTVPTLTYADTVLVGTNLSSINAAAGVLCPQGSNCSDRASQFTVVTPVVIDSISVVVSGPSEPGHSSDGNFTIGLGSALGVGDTIGIGAGDLIFDPQNDFITEEFTFGGLDLSLGAGTYYLGMAGGNLEWDYAPPLLTPSTGLLGKQFSCDPFITCGNPAEWDTLSSNTYAIEIDGTVVTPEPSTFVLLGTGLVGVIAGVKRSFPLV